MRWPYNARIDAVHAWGMVATGITIDGIIVGALTATHGIDPHFHRWWPTNWLSIPVGIVLIGLTMVVVPLRRHDDQTKEEAKRPELLQGPPPFVQNITANSPGSTAQGSAFGNVINYVTQPGNEPTALVATESTDKQS